VKSRGVYKRWLGLKALVRHLASQGKTDIRKKKRTNKSKQVDEERVKGMLEQKRHKATLLLALQGATS